MPVAVVSHSCADIYAAGGVIVGVFITVEIDVGIVLIIPN